LSAIGIIIIVSGHCYNGGVSLMYDWFPKYSYNLALFVFISGYFYKEKHEEHIFKYIWGRTKRLLIPAYLWNIVYGIIAFALTQVGYTIAQGKFDLYNLFVMPFIDGESFAYNLGSWFVYPLFCVYVFNILFRKLLKKVHRGNEYVILAVYLAIGIFGVQYCIWNPAPNGALLLLFRSMFFLPCFEFGRFYHEKLEKHDNLNSVAYFAIVLGVQLLLLTFCENLEYTPSKCVKFDNGCVIPYVTAITGIAFWLRVAQSHSFKGKYCTTQAVLFCNNAHTACFLSILKPVKKALFHDFFILFTLSVRLLFCILFKVCSFINSNILCVTFPIRIGMNIPAAR
jgi:fucose 4-O-acetylase-like acetyltransferase